MAMKPNIVTYYSRQAVGATDGDQIYQLTANPLSALILTLQANLVSGNTSDDWRSLLDQLQAVNFRFRGSSIWNIS